MLSSVPILWSFEVAPEGSCLHWPSSSTGPYARAWYQCCDRVYKSAGGWKTGANPRFGHSVSTDRDGRKPLTLVNA